MGVRAWQVDVCARREAAAPSSGGGTGQHERGHFCDSFLESRWQGRGPDGIWRDVPERSYLQTLVGIAFAGPELHRPLGDPAPMGPCPPACLVTCRTKPCNMVKAPLDLALDCSFRPISSPLPAPFPEAACSGSCVGLGAAVNFRQLGPESSPPGMPVSVLLLLWRLTHACPRYGSAPPWLQLLK